MPNRLFLEITDGYLLNVIRYSSSYPRHNRAISICPRPVRPWSSIRRALTRLLFWAKQRKRKGKGEERGRPLHLLITNVYRIQHHHEYLVIPSTSDYNRASILSFNFTVKPSVTQTPLLSTYRATRAPVVKPDYNSPTPPYQILPLSHPQHRPPHQEANTTPQSYPPPSKSLLSSTPNPALIQVLKPPFLPRLPPSSQLGPLSSTLLTRQPSQPNSFTKPMHSK